MANLTEQDVFGTEPALERLGKELEDLYPLVTPSPNDSIEQIMYRSGQRSVVDYILSKMEEP
jgi:hypothetical protein